MASYVVTGASRGLGFEFLRQLSENPESIVIGLTRDKKATEEKVKAEINRPNIHILQAGPTDYPALKKAAEDTAEITGGKLDYVIANAVFVTKETEYANLGTLGENPEHLEKDLLDQFQANTIGPIHTFNLFVPLLKKGSAKKAIAISSGMADPDLIKTLEMDISPAYAITKGALNMAVSKFDAQYRKEGLLFMAISPGLVDTGGLAANNLTQEQQQGMQDMAAKFAKVSSPGWNGPITPEVSVKAVTKVINDASIENGSGGSFVSHWGNKIWL